MAGKETATILTTKSKPTLRFDGKDVLKDVGFGDKVKLEIEGECTEIGKQEWDRNRIHQTITIKKMKVVE